jgi:DNA-directed RNA polymerase specialized sigma24 family protein
MAHFPDTRPTLVRRLSEAPSQSDWQDFFLDYWPPIVAFAWRRGVRPHEAAEEVASRTFEVLIAGDLLARWSAAPQAKLRTLVCAVACRIMSHSRRVEGNRRRLWQDFVRELESSPLAADAEQESHFDAAWADHALRTSVADLARDYAAQGKADYIRVLHGRLCRGLTLAVLASTLSLHPSAVDRYFRHARDALEERLRMFVHAFVARYCEADDLDAECQREWERLGEILTLHGGLESAVRDVYDQMMPESDPLARLTSILQARDDRHASEE